MIWPLLKNNKWSATNVFVIYCLETTLSFLCCEQTLNKSFSILSVLLCKFFLRIFISHNSIETGEGQKMSTFSREISKSKTNLRMPKKKLKSLTTIVMMTLKLLASKRVITEHFMRWKTRPKKSKRRKVLLFHIFVNRCIMCNSYSFQYSSIRKVRPRYLWNIVTKVCKGAGGN